MKTVGLQINISQMLEMLSASLYKGDVLAVATRELLQNSFDAVKGTAHPRIEVSFDNKSSELIFRDNGTGMTPETVENVFLTIGGTLKDGLDFEDRSGGFGIAKVQFFMCAERIYVETHKGEVTTILDCSNTELISGTASIKLVYEDRPNGTEVKLRFPSTYKDVNGNVKEAKYSQCSVFSVLNKPLLGYSDVEVIWRGQNFNNLKHMNVVRDSKPWGDIEIYYRIQPGMASQTYLDYNVHCAGLFQFKKDDYVGNYKGLDDVMINIRPKHPAGSQYYPFANSRDNFSAFVAKDVEDMIKDIVKLGKALHAKELIDSMSNIAILSYCPVSAGHKNVSGEKVSGKAPDISLLKDMNMADFIKVVMEYHTAINKISEKIEEDKKNNQSTHIRLINSDNIIVDNFVMSKVASVVYDAIYDKDVVLLITERGIPAPTIAGVIIDRTVRGRYVKTGDTRAVYLNPLDTEWYSGDHFAETLTNTLIHELAHCLDNCDYHGDDFFVCQSDVRKLFWKTELYNKIYSKFLAIYKDHSKDLVIKDWS